MADNRKNLLEKTNDWYANFGKAIKLMEINGFRGISNLKIEIEYPITAISGTNGSGKSTIGQLALCAYNQPQNGSDMKNWYVSKFFPYSKVDNPFINWASVQFQYAVDSEELQSVKIVRNGNKAGWSDYSLRPEKPSFYIGLALFIPKIERKDFSIYNSYAMIVEKNKKRLFKLNILQNVSNILNSKYEEIAFQPITNGADPTKQKELGVARKHGHSYSENNMGFGEGRLMYMIDLLENKSDKSLFVIEEPETSLHEDAQYKFILYLMDVCNRKGHQIILSTHSSIILEALPPQGRKFIIRDKSGVKILDRVSAGRAKSLLTDGREKALTICVEDDFAKLVLEEAIRKFGEPKLLQSLQIAPVGDSDAVRNSLKLLLNDPKHKAIAIRDADKGEDVTNKLYKLPGTLSPEKEVYENTEVQRVINEKYNIDIETIFAGLSNLDHHDYGKILAEKACCKEDTMNVDAIRAYLNIVGQEAFDNLLQVINKEMETKK
jgi:predicted ATPase